MGSGWLVSKEVFVTAGHCVYDWSHKFGRVTKMKCFVGYNGKESLGKNDNSQVQFRPATRVMTTVGWRQQRDRSHDVAFVRVDQAFEGNLNTFTFMKTPAAPSSIMLGVVGYPGDMCKWTATGREHGAEMYKMFAYHPSGYDLSRASGVIKHKISTAGGKRRCRDDCIEVS